MVNFNLTLIWHRTYTSYWFIPFVMSLVGVCLPYLTVQYDLQLRDSFFVRSLAWMWPTSCWAPSSAPSSMSSASRFP